MSSRRGQTSYSGASWCGPTRSFDAAALACRRPPFICQSADLPAPDPAPVGWFRGKPSSEPTNSPEENAAAFKVMSHRERATWLYDLSSTDKAAMFTVMTPEARSELLAVVPCPADQYDPSTAPSPGAALPQAGWFQGAPTPVLEADWDRHAPKTIRCPDSPAVVHNVLQCKVWLMEQFDRAAGSTADQPTLAARNDLKRQLWPHCKGSPDKPGIRTLLPLYNQIEVMRAPTVDRRDFGLMVDRWLAEADQPLLAAEIQALAQAASLPWQNGIKQIAVPVVTTEPAPAPTPERVSADGTVAARQVTAGAETAEDGEAEEVRRLRMITSKRECRVWLLNLFDQVAVGTQAPRDELRLRLLQATKRHPKIEAAWPLCVQVQELSTEAMGRIQFTSMVEAWLSKPGVAEAMAREITAQEQALCGLKPRGFHDSAEHSRRMSRSEVMSLFDRVALVGSVSAPQAELCKQLAVVSAKLPGSGLWPLYSEVASGNEIVERAQFERMVEQWETRQDSPATEPVRAGSRLSPSLVRSSPNPLMGWFNRT